MRKKIFSTLLIEDNEADYEFVRRELYLQSSNRPADFTVVWKQTVAQGINALTEQEFDIIFLDLSFPDSSGIENFRKIKAIAPDLPVIVMGGPEDENSALKIIEEGAQDYIIKGKFPGLLPKTVTYALQRHESLRQLELNERSARSAALAKSAFFASMSHEIRTPLTSVIGYSEVLLSSTSLKTDEAKRAIKTIFSNGRHLLQVINDILDISKIEAGELKIEKTRGDLRVLLRDVLQTFLARAKEKNIAFSIDFSPPAPTSLETDFFRLKQILYNLVGNAIKFTSEGFVKVQISVDDGQENILFEVKDSGIGIPEEMKVKLFKAYAQGDAERTRKFGGSGLGLVISGQLAHQLGGGIDFQSREKVGSVFALKVPLGEVGRASLTAKFPSLEDDADSQTKTAAVEKLVGHALIVDDYEDNRNLLSLLLRGAGLTVDFAEDGIMALEKVAKSKFDIMLLDMQMPRMDGKTVARTLRSQGNTIPMVAVTASVLDESLAECLRAGCDACLRKPFRREELIDCVAKFLSQGTKKEKNPALAASVRDDELSEVRQGFLRRLPQRLEEIETAFDTKDLDRLKAEAHRIISAGLFGFQDLSHLGGILESLIIQEQTGGLSLVEAMVKRIRGEVSKIALEQQSSNNEGAQNTNITPTVIVADDDEINMKVVARILSIKGFLIAPARSIEETIALCEEGPFALLVVSLEMNNMSGCDLIKKVRDKLERKVPVIAMTSRPPSEVRASLGSLGVSHLLTKPIVRDRLFEAIDGLVMETLSG